jgi:transcriptional regulator with XRE-family HTH domain
MTKFNKEDENYIYEVIGKNIKKYRRLKGWTQEKLAEEIDYSLSFISAIESDYHQTFSIGAIWRISRVLDVDFTKLCEDDSLNNKSKSICYKCDKCGEESMLPTQMVKIFKDLYEVNGSKNLPTFDCTKEDCNGKIHPTNPMDF